MGNLTWSCPYVEHVLMLALIGFTGLIDSCFGPSLQDLQCLYSVSVQTISTLFPVYAGFKAAGSVLYVPFHAVFNVYTLMMVCVLVSSCLVLVIPLCSSFWVAAAASIGLGLTAGVINTAVVATIGKLSQSPMPIHLMGLFLFAGYILGPLIISPFLNNKNCTTHGLNETGIHSGTTDSSIVYAYLSFSLTGIILAMFLPIARCHQNHIVDKPTKPMNKCSYGKLECIFIVFLMSLMLIGGGTNFVYGTLLLLFGTNSSLHIPENIMALMTSSMYAVTLFGRVGGVVVSLVVPQLGLITGCLVGVSAGSVLLVITAERSLAYLWVGSNVLGLCYSPFFAATLAWGVESVDVNENTYVMFSFFDIAGASVITLIIGQLMSLIDPQMLHYSMAVISVIQILIMLGLFYLRKLMKERKKEEYTVLSET